MFTVLLSLIAGLLLGFLLRFRLPLLTVVDRLAGWAVLWLIFLLGVSVGANEIVLANLDRLGVQALVLSSGALIGSVVICRLVTTLFFQISQHEG
jgi:uncharacterized membrane protein YbjE (DUF340 family)